MSEDPFGICEDDDCEDEIEKELPSSFEMAKNLLSSIKEIAGGIVSGDRLLVVEQVYDERMDTCRGCEKFIQESERCSACGCFMKKKALFTRTTCPLEKWEE